MTTHPFHTPEVIRDPVRLRVPLQLTRREAEALSKWLRRLTFADLQAKAGSDAEAYALLVTTERVRAALHEVRFIPRLGRR